MMSVGNIVSIWEAPTQTAGNYVHKHVCMAVPPYITEKLNPSTAAHTKELLHERKVAVLNPERTLAIHEEPKSIRIFNAHNSKGHSILPGKLLAHNLDPISDISGHEVYKISDDFYKFLLNVHQRKSYGGHNEEMKTCIHYSDNPKVGFDNAFWNGRYYVSGDGHIFRRMSSSPTVGYHEWTHAVTGDRLNYERQAGALNESVSDVFALVCDMYIKKQTVVESKWLIGDELIDDDKLKGVQALRSLKDPGTAYKDHPQLGSDPQPADMSGYIDTKEDDGGVHYNSGIPNRAFYLTAKNVYDKSGNDPKAVHAWENVGHIWYDALQSCRPDSTFLQFAQLTIEVAKKKFGENSREHSSVLAAWTEVKVLGFKPPTQA